MTEIFKTDVQEGLSAFPKFLSSKYFYDKTGDELFQKIMNLPEYYLTRAELEIFQKKSRWQSQKWANIWMDIQLFFGRYGGLIWYTLPIINDKPVRSERAVRSSQRLEWGHCPRHHWDFQWLVSASFSSLSTLVPMLLFIAKGTWRELLVISSTWIKGPLNPL